jgi:hypothetical protein
MADLMLPALARISPSGADDTKPIILLLDGNARTKSEQAGGDLTRLSSDQKPVSPRGQRMLSAWKRSKLVILNGTHLEDASPGRFTSMKEVGTAEAVVDYAVVSESLVPMVRSLSVATPSPPKEAWSGHVSLVLKMDRSISMARRGLHPDSGPRLALLAF